MNTLKILHSQTMSEMIGWGWADVNAITMTVIS